MELKHNLFETERNLYRDINGSAPFFVSDWDIDRDLIRLPLSAIDRAFRRTHVKVHEYSFIEDQLWVKHEIGQEFAIVNSELAQVPFTFALNGTASIYLSLKAICELGSQRVLTFLPSYYSALDTLADLKQPTFFFHLDSNLQFDIDLERVATVIRQQSITALLITDPVYCFGTAVTTGILKGLAEICRKNDCWLIVDHTLGGLEWHGPKVVPVDKILATSKAGKYVFIDSLAKRLLINGLKFATVFGDTAIIARIETLAGQVTGGFAMPQLQLIKQLYQTSNSDGVLELLQQTCATAAQQHKLLSTIVQGTPYQTSRVGSGFFCSVIHSSILHRAVDEVAMFKKMLHKHQILFLPTGYLTSTREGNFSLRINLLKDFRPHVISIISALNDHIDLIKHKPAN